MFNALRSNTTAGSLSALYVSTFLSGAWAMIIPTIPVLAREFDVSAGGAAQVITAFAFGKMAGTLIGGFLANTFNPGVPFVAYAPLLLVSALLLLFVGQETLEK